MFIKLMHQDGFPIVINAEKLDCFYPAGVKAPGSIVSFGNRIFTVVESWEKILALIEAAREPAHEFDRRFFSPSEVRKQIDEAIEDLQERVGTLEDAKAPDEGA